MKYSWIAALLLLLVGCVFDQDGTPRVEYVGPPQEWAVGTFHLSVDTAPGWAVNLTIRPDGRFYVSSYHCRFLHETLGQKDRPISSSGRADALSNGHLGLQDADYRDDKLMNWPWVVADFASLGPAVLLIWEWQVAFFRRGGEFFSDGTHTPELQWRSGEVCSVCDAQGAVRVEPCLGETPHALVDPFR